MMLHLERGTGIVIRPRTQASLFAEVALAPSGPGTAAERWGFSQLRGRPFAVLALVFYLGWLTGAELSVALVNPVLVFPLHGGLVLLAMLHLAGIERRRRDDGAPAGGMAPFLLAFMLAPLIRLISLTLPLAQIEAPYRYLFAGIAMSIGAVAVLRLSGMDRRDVGIAWRAGGWQLRVAIVAIPLGIVEYIILRPDALGPLPWAGAGLAPALAVAFSTGFPEELVFRGVLQTAARPVLGRWNWLYVSAIFAVLHIGYLSVVDIGFVMLVGSLYGIVFERTRSILGISVSHGLANVILFFVMPNLPAAVGLPYGPY